MGQGNPASVKPPGGRFATGKKERTGPFLPCALEREVSSCAVCDDFPCDKVRHLLTSREGLLLYLYPKSATLSEETYNLCMRQFESMPKLLQIMVEHGRLPAWIRDV